MRLFGLKGRPKPAIFWPARAAQAIDEQIIAKRYEEFLAVWRTANLAFLRMFKRTSSIRSARSTWADRQREYPVMVGKLAPVKGSILTIKSLLGSNRHPGYYGARECSQRPVLVLRFGGVQALHVRLSTTQSLGVHSCLTRGLRFKRGDTSPLSWLV